MSDLIITAKKISYDAHSGQFRKYSKLPYITHPERVANLVAAKRNNEILIAAAWLHDVLEDTYYNRFELLNSVGNEVFFLVTELTNTSKIWLEGANREARKKLDLTHLKHISPEAKFIKLCDRLDNISDLQDCCKTSFKEVYRKETEALLDVLKGTDEEYETKMKEILSKLI